MKKQTLNLLYASALVLSCMSASINANAQCQWFQDTATGCGTPQQAKPGSPPMGNYCSSIIYSPEAVQECYDDIPGGYCSLVAEDLTSTYKLWTDYGAACGYPVLWSHSYASGTCDQAVISLPYCGE